jgi:hypothetical protein
MVPREGDAYDILRELEGTWLGQDGSPDPGLPGLGRIRNDPLPGRRRAAAEAGDEQSQDDGAI